MASDDTTPPQRGDRRGTTEYFGRLATTYGDGRYYALRRRAVVDAIALEMRGAKAVLDLGCGNGNYLAEFARVAGSCTLIGIDLTFAMLAQARDRALEVAGLVRADVTALPVRSARFDIVFCSHVLPFVADLDTGIGEISRGLRDGGALIATLPGDNIVRRELETILGADRYAEFARMVFRRQGRPRSAPGAEHERYRKSFAQAGLQFEERSAPYAITWQDAAEWIRIRWYPVMAAADRPAIDQMLDEVSADSGAQPMPLVEPLVIGRKVGRVK